MKDTDSIKEIRFQKKSGGTSFFDFIPYSELMRLRPADHSQFEHHRLSFFVLLLIYEGQAKHAVNFKEYDCPKGTVLSIGKDNIHKFYPSQAQGSLLIFTEDFVLQFMSQKSSERIYRLFNEHLTSPKTVLNDELYSGIYPYLKAIETEFKKTKDEFSPELIRNYLQIIITTLLRLKTTQESTLEDSKYLSRFLEFQRLVEQGYAENKSVQYYASTLGITTRTLNNICNGIAQKSAKAVIQDIQMTRIKRYLINTEFTISQVAAKTGFFDTSQFAKFFRKNTDMSPKDFQSQFRNKA